MYTADSPRQWPAAPPPSLLSAVQADPCTGLWVQGVRAEEVIEGPPALRREAVRGEPMQINTET